MKNRCFSMLGAQKHRNMMAESEQDVVHSMMDYSPRGDGTYCGWKQGVCVDTCEPWVAPTYSDGIGHKMEPMACYIRNARNGSGVCVLERDCLPQGSYQEQCVADCYGGKGCLGPRTCEDNAPGQTRLNAPGSYEACVKACEINDPPCFSFCGVTALQCEDTCARLVPQSEGTKT